MQHERLEFKIKSHWCSFKLDRSPLDNGKIDSSFQVYLAGRYILQIDLR